LASLLDVGSPRIVLKSAMEMSAFGLSPMRHSSPCLTWISTPCTFLVLTPSNPATVRSSRLSASPLVSSSRNGSVFPPDDGPTTISHRAPSASSAVLVAHANTARVVSKSSTLT
jgi:hypothetical protein